MPRPNSRSPEADPAAFLGDELKRLRLAAGFPTQEALARKTGYPRETITRSETGAIPPGATLLTDLLDSCRATEEVRGIMTRAAVLARNADVSVPRFIEWWIEIERQATLIRIWQPLLVPGLLQVPAYAAPLFAATGADQEQVAAKLDVRLDRQAILQGDDAATLVVVLDEAVLYRLIDTVDTMAEQLTHLLAIAERPNVIIEVVRDAGPYAGLGGAFQIASGSTVPDTLLMLAVEDQTTDNQILTRKAIGMFEQIRSNSLTAQQTRAAIKEAIQHWNRQQSPQAGESPATAATVARTA